jgi:hypothetical protein
MNVMILIKVGFESGFEEILGGPPEPLPYFNSFNV